MKASVLASALLFFALLPASAGATAPNAPPGADAAHNAPRLHRAGGKGYTYETTAHWIESAKGLVLIDALMLNSEAERLAAAMKATGKPVLGIILTHPHIDHFGGLSTLKRHFPDAPIYASAATIAAIRPVHERAIALGWVAEFGDDYAQDVVIPDHPLPDEGDLVLADQSLHVRSYGAMEADDNLVVYSEALGAASTGDAVVAGHVYYLGEGHVEGALAGLTRMAADFPQGVMSYPSHGESALLQPTINENIRQIRTMRDAVADALARADKSGPLGKAERAELIRALSTSLAGLSSYGIPLQAVVDLNVDGLLKSLVPAPVEPEN